MLRAIQSTRKRTRWQTVVTAVARIPVIAWGLIWRPVAAIAGHSQKIRADELQKTLDRARADAAWDKERLTGQIAILQEQLKAYVDISTRERARVAAEIAMWARRERNAQHSVSGGGEPETLI